MASANTRLMKDLSNNPNKMLHQEITQFNSPVGDAECLLVTITEGWAKPTPFQVSLG
jgi:hypothetical protein